MELRQLQYFQTASRLKSISKAAEYLNVAQPSVSIAIHKLEEQLGITLFDRSQRQIELTAEGLIFFQRVNEILTRVQDSITEMKDLRLLQKGFIKIGIPPMIGAFLFPHIFAQLRQAYPLLEIKALEGGSLSIQKLLEQGKLDVAIITKSSVSDTLELLPIAKGQIMVCLPYDHPLSTHTSATFDQLKTEPFILLKEDTYIRQMITSQCEQRMITPNIVFSTSQIETIIGLVEQGIGISFLFDAITRKHDSIRSIPFTKPIFYEIVLAWNKNRYLSNAAKALIEFITHSPSVSNLLQLDKP